LLTKSNKFKDNWKAKSMLKTSIWTWKVFWINRSIASTKFYRVVSKSSKSLLS